MNFGKLFLISDIYNRKYNLSQFTDFIVSKILNLVFFKIGRLFQKSFSIFPNQAKHRISLYFNNLFDLSGNEIGNNTFRDVNTFTFPFLGSTSLQ